MAGIAKIAQRPRINVATTSKVERIGAQISKATRSVADVLVDLGGESIGNVISVEEFSKIASGARASHAGREFPTFWTDRLGGGLVINIVSRRIIHSDSRSEVIVVTSTIMFTVVCRVVSRSAGGEGGVSDVVSVSVRAISIMINITRTGGGGSGIAVYPARNGSIVCCASEINGVTFGGPVSTRGEVCIV